MTHRLAVIRCTHRVGLEQPNQEAPEFSGIAAKFPKTSWTLLDAMRAGSDGGAKARSEFARLYYHPINAFSCAAVKKAEEAEKLAQELFEVAIVAGTVVQRADRDRKLPPLLAGSHAKLPSG